jgi:predicted CopG family antitoxin
MRTTLTIDDDVAAQLERLRRGRRDASLKDIINEALRRGLKEMTARPKKRKPFRTQTFDVGQSMLDNVDNVAEVLAIIEGDAYK